jgi:hypothetical protein
MTDPHLKMLDVLIADHDSVISSREDTYYLAVKRSQDPSSPIYLPPEQAAAWGQRVNRSHAVSKALSAIRFEYVSGKTSPLLTSILESMMSAFPKPVKRKIGPSND